MIVCRLVPLSAPGFWFSSGWVSTLAPQGGSGSSARLTMELLGRAELVAALTLAEMPGTDENRAPEPAPQPVQPRPQLHAQNLGSSLSPRTAVKPAPTLGPRAEITKGTSSLKARRVLTGRLKQVPPHPTSTHLHPPINTLPPGSQHTCGSLPIPPPT